MKDINQEIGKGPQCKGCKFTTDPNMACSNPQICVGRSLHEHMTDYEIFLRHSCPIKLDADNIKVGVKPETSINKMTKEEAKHDMINRPRHYKTKNGLEAIDVIEAFTDGLEGIEATDTGNAIKYILRWKHKNGIEDLKKCVWYINHLIKHLDPNDPEFKESDKYFKCPSCGGNIVRDLIEIRTNGFSNLINVLGEPTCDSCGSTYVVKINEDMSYEITSN